MNNLIKKHEQAILYLKLLKKSHENVNVLYKKLNIEENKEDVKKYLFASRKWYLEEIEKHKNIIKYLEKRYSKVSEIIKNAYYE